MWERLEKLSSNVTKPLGKTKLCYGFLLITFFFLSYGNLMQEGFAYSNCCWGSSFSSSLLVCQQYRMSGGYMSGGYISLFLRC